MSTRLLSIAAELSAPPSCHSCFRDVTLYGSIKGYEVVATAEPETLDSYNNWFKRYGLWDYLEDLIPEDQLNSASVTVEITGGPNARLTMYNLNEVLSYL